MMTRSKRLFTGGSAGNQQLTAFVASVLLLLLAIEGALHFSRRSAEIYVNCAKAAGILDSALAPFHYCLSPQVAKPLAGAGKIRIARQPDEAALINLVMST